MPNTFDSPSKRKIRKLTLVHTSPVRREPKSLFDFKDLLLSYQALSKISPFYFFNEKKKKKKEEEHFFF